MQSKSYTLELIAGKPRVLTSFRFNRNEGVLMGGSCAFEYIQGSDRARQHFVGFQLEAWN